MAVVKACGAERRLVAEAAAYGGETEEEEEEEDRARELAAALLRVEAKNGWVGGRWGEGNRKQGRSKADVGESKGRKDAREPCAALIKLLRHDARNFMSALQVY